VIDVYWLVAERKIGTYPASTANSGKWLIFIKRAEIDAWWTKIKAATEQGSFGDLAKVSTSKPNPNASDPNEHVICVYTYDWTDEEDVRRVRQALGDLGVVWEIGYKADQETKAKLYAVHGNLRFCKYYEAAPANKELTRLWGVGPVTAGHLEEIGIKTFHDLAAADSYTITKALRDRRRYVSPMQVEHWKHHATSYSTSRPVVFGDPLTLDGPFFGLDLEYDPNGFIWLIGVCLAGPGGREYFPLWADTPAQEKSNLMRLAEIVAANPLLPVITWNGNGADMPELRKAAHRQELGQALDIVQSRHLDLFQHATRSVRFPFPELSLGQVASYFAIPKVSWISDGLVALLQYREYQRSRDEGRRVTLKKNLLEYNREDLDAIVGVAERFAALQST
jgi:predicted RecB family nuclease